MNKQYTVGIFWYINRLFITKLQRKAPDRLTQKTGKVDSDYSHFVVWDELAVTFPHADFATFPRGRILYDAGNRRYIIYADICIPDQMIKRFAKQYHLTPCVIARDEHYRCDSCMDSLQ